MLDEYPEGDPTPLARVGARPRQFVVGLNKLFKKYGVKPPRLDYRLNEPLVQRIPGNITRDLRFSWFVTPDGEENFPFPKSRASLFNHAEDAAILAACPPHTWRPLIWCHTADRLKRNGDMGPRPGLAVPELAPDWAGYLRSRKKPVVRILGRYPVTWKSKFADLTFWREPQRDTPRLKRYKLLKDIQRKDFENIVSPAMRSEVEKIAVAVGLSERGTMAEALARKNAGQDARRSAVERELPHVLEELEQKYPRLRRIQVSSQKGGTLAVLKPSDGPARKVQIKPASEGLVVWQAPKGTKVKTAISLLRPRPLRAFGIPRIYPPIPAGASILGQLYRHQMIELEGLPDRPEGFYRITKCQANGITLQPEEAVPAEIARRIGARLDNKQPGKTGEEESEKANFVLGKQALVEFLEDRKKKRQNAR